MWDYIVVGGIIGICAFFIGRKFYRQLKAAANPAVSLECGCGCSGGCSVSACPDRKEKEGRV
jgi:hypothetical protein